MESSIAILGPSHIYNWIKLIDTKNEESIPYFMYGEPGLSIYSKSFQNFLDWWVLDKNKKAVILVPDFRIGNPGLATTSINNLSDAVFVYQNVMNMSNDFILKKYALDTLDLYCEKYGNNIKFIFWCLYGREQTNIYQNKYITDGIYKHPVWNYSELLNKYSENTIDINSLGSRMLDIIEPDGTIHPNSEGYKFIYEIIKNNFDG